MHRVGIAWVERPLKRLAAWLDHRLRRIAGGSSYAPFYLVVASK